VRTTICCISLALSSSHRNRSFMFYGPRPMSSQTKSTVGYRTRLTIHETSENNGDTPIWYFWSVFGWYFSVFTKPLRTNKSRWYVATCDRRMKMAGTKIWRERIASRIGRRSSSCDTSHQQCYQAACTHNCENRTESIEVKVIEIVEFSLSLSAYR
jgi:hypothetical protein